MTASRSRTPRVFLVFSMIFVCVLIGGALWGISSLLDRTERLYGKPDNGVGWAQRIIYAIDLIRYESDLLNPNEFSDKDIREFQIGTGESIPSIVNRLQNEGLIQNADAFQTYLIYSGLDVTMQAGDYQISSGLNAMEIAQLFQDATPSTIAFGILPGWRLEEVAAALPSSGLAISPKEFLRTALLPATKKGYSWSDAASVEGFILPAIYDVGRDASASELFDTILKGFDEQVTTELRFGISEQGLSLEEAVILASIVEREAVVADEKPVIASVFVNRLALGMRLESDPTVQYAIGFNEAQQTWWKNPLLTNDLKSNSLYNTYLHAGLPPGPICNPSLEALQAVAFPAQTPYYFFRARCDGSGYHDFSITFEEHLQKACP